MLQLHVQIKVFSQSEEIKNKKFLCGCTHSSCTRAIPKRNEDTFSAKLSHRRTHEPLRVRLPSFIHRESENRNRRQRAWWETRQAAAGVSGLRLTSCPSQRLVPSSSLWPENETTPGTPGAPTAAPAQRRTIAKRARRFQR